MPSPSKAAVLRLTLGSSAGNGWTMTSSVSGLTVTIAFNPPSVIHGQPSGPTITPCGAEPAPSGIVRTSPVDGSRYPSSPVRCPVYQTPPSAAGATSCGRDPAGTSNHSMTGSIVGTGDGSAVAVGVGAGSRRVGVGLCGVGVGFGCSKVG